MRGKYLLAGCALIIATSAQAQDASLADPAPIEAEGGDIVVTAVARGANLLDTSISVSSLNAEAITAASPRSAAELLRNIPGIRSESSGGEGNANIAVRGLPVASGGAKFLQLQEDGLPILEFGDIAFGNADIFLRSDFNIARVESVRGGSASTFASNSPGGVINFISKTGEQEGGAVQATLGLDYEEYRLDFDYGAKLADDLVVHIGGFYRQGTGPRDVGYNGLKGGQLKANITKKFDRGYIRLYGKYLDDRAVGYLPNPVEVTGSDRDPKYRNLPGFSINEDSLHSRNFRRALALDGNGDARSYDITDGMRPLVKSLGFESSFELNDAISLINRFRFSDISGGFISPFPASVDTATNVATGLGATALTFANGPNAGQAVPGDALLARIVLFNTRLNSLDNITNDLRLNFKSELGTGSLDLTAGFYASRQDIDIEWLWTSHLLEVRGNGEAALVDAFNGATPLTDNGTVGYGATFFGNCCRRSYDLRYRTLAPFLSATFETGALTLDGSARFDLGNARGTTIGDGPVTPTDVDGDGLISAAEALTTLGGVARNVDYDYDYTSYSLGANYKLQDNLAVFARYSKGGRANADRILLNNNNINPVTGQLLSNAVAIDFVKQWEGGVKYRSGPLSLFGTLFYAKTEEENFEATTQTTTSRTYKAKGVELEGSYRVGDFGLRAGATYTDAEINRDAISPANVGNQPRRQAKFVYQLNPSYDADRFSLGANIVGTGDSYAQDNNQLIMPGFTQVNAYLQLRPVDRVQLSVNANNLFNVKGITEVEEGAIPANGLVRARSINGRTLSASVKYSF
jgi:outer membrane receptor protein involved in Fe transport